MTKISEGFYLGGINEITHDFLSEHKIQCVINVAQECVYTLSGIIVHKFDILDRFVDIDQYFEPVIQIIQSYKNKGPILIHCMAGISRSATFVLAYLIKDQAMPLLHAYNHVRRRRNIMPNPCFMGQLMDFERSVLGIDTSTFDHMIDDYTVKYLVISLEIDQEHTDQVKNVYLANNKDYELTKLATQPIGALISFRSFFAF